MNPQLEEIQKYSAVVEKLNEAIAKWCIGIILLVFIKNQDFDIHKMREFLTSFEDEKIIDQVFKEIDIDFLIQRGKTENWFKIGISYGLFGEE